MRILIQSFFAVFMELFCYKLFIEAFCDYRSKSHRTKSYLMLLSMFTEVILIVFLIQNFMVKQLVISAVLFLNSKFFFKVKNFKVITFTWIYMGLMLAIEYICLICHSYLVAITDYNEANMETIAVVTAELIEFLVVLVIRRLAWKSKGEDLTEKEWVRCLFFPVFSICVYAVIESNSYFMSSEENDKLICLSAFGILGMNVIVFCFVRDISARESQIRENRLAGIKANNQIMLYQSIVNNFERQNERLHEYKNQIECLNALSRNERYDELERYLEQIGTELSIETDAVDTHHAVANVIINSKYHEAVESGIIMVLKLDDLSGLWLNEHDIVVILANMLDNAIEACKKTEARRIIKMKMSVEKRCLVLSVINTYDGNIKSREGILLSTKENAGHEHGIGVKNIIRIVEKYGGNYIIDTQGTEFVFSIIIPRNEKMPD